MIAGIVLVILVPLFGLLRFLLVQRGRLPRGAAVLWLTDREIGGYDVTSRHRQAVIAQRAGLAFSVQYGDGIGFRDHGGVFRILSLDLLRDDERRDALGLLGLTPWRSPV